MKNIPYFSQMNAIQSMAQQTFTNQKLEFVEELASSQEELARERPPS